MLISQAFASDTPVTSTAPAVDGPAGDAAAVAAAAPTSGLMGQFMLIGVMFLLFYMLLIRPQQKRLKAQQSMLSALKVGDKVITGGGLLGIVSKIISDAEVEVDLGQFKVTALRYTLTARNDQPAN
ncbi:MAG TPA: preprotein translocase subunit YajC [Alphaproteobacteria bacterium]